jgi:hypothetical protein
MKQSRQNQEISFIRARALEDLANTSDDEIRKEYREAGQDLSSVAKQTHAKLQDVVAAGMRARLASAKATSKATAAIHPIDRIRPAMERLKEIVAEAFQREPKIAMAFRDGKKQTDEDLATVYDDLVRMGVVKPEDYGH